MKQRPFADTRLHDIARCTVYEVHAETPVRDAMAHGASVGDLVAALAGSEPSGRA